MKPYINDTDFTLYVGDVLDVLRELPDEHVHCCVTSPPYWGLRDYGTGTWEGGNDPDCDHKHSRATADALHDGTSERVHGPHRGGDTSSCGKCGATRVDKQLGLEPTPEEYVARMVAVFAEVRRVLRRDGTLWLNIGDSYTSGGSGQNGTGDSSSLGAAKGEASRAAAKRYGEVVNDRRRPQLVGTKPKDLVGIPWKLAFALQADGWYLRSDIIWAKPNPMPESVTDRPTKAHEYLFLLTRSPRYFYDADAIREGYEEGWKGRLDTSPGTVGRIGGRGGFVARGPDGRRKTTVLAGDGSAQHRDGERWPNPQGRNKRSVWEIATEAYPDAHFATYPQALVEPCVKAGSPPGGIVLDPFMGSGTTALVARRHGRRSVGIELNPDYATMCAKRLSQLSLLAEAAA